MNAKGVLIGTPFFFKTFFNLILYTISIVWLIKANLNLKRTCYDTI